jgi:hypothetical protein
MQAAQATGVATIMVPALDPGTTALTTEWDAALRMAGAAPGMVAQTGAGLPANRMMRTARGTLAAPPPIWRGDHSARGLWTHGSGSAPTCTGSMSCGGRRRTEFGQRRRDRCRWGRYRSPSHSGAAKQSHENSSKQAAYTKRRVCRTSITGKLLTLAPVLS